MAESAQQARPRVAANPPAAEAPAARRVPDPHESPAEYLRSKGWKPLGPADSPACLWLDPTKPAAGRWGKEAVMTERWVKEDGDEKPRKVVEPLMAQAGDGENRKRPAVQTVYHTPAVPVNTQQALLEQIERDQRALTAEAN